MSQPLSRPLALALALALASPTALAARFVYEGRLDDAGQPANGRYDLKLTAFGHAAQGATLAAPLTFEGVEVRDGRFRLDVDLPLVQADQVWLEVAVRGAGEPVFAEIPGRAKAIAAPLIGACWSTTGDSGSDPATNFIGTTDAQPFVVRTRNVQSLRIEPSAESFGGDPITANVIAGSSANNVTAGVRGATIAGGGSANTDPDFGLAWRNRVTDSYGTVGGGAYNDAGDSQGTLIDSPFATVGGGMFNRARAGWSTIAGGRLNTTTGEAGTIGGGAANSASGPSSTIAGGRSNTARGEDSTIGGGFAHHALGDWSSISGGYRNATIGSISTVAGGAENCAGASYSWVGGRYAKVRPASDPGGAIACSGLTYPGGQGDRGTFVWADSQESNFVSTGSNQFLVRASGGVGFNTNAPATDFDVVGNRAGHAALIRNQTGTSADGLAIRINLATPTTANNFLSFQRNDGSNVGSVEGNGAGGVAFNTSGGDYAEYLPLADGVAKATLRGGEVVAVRGGRVSLDTAGAEQLGVVSTNPAVSGNDPGEAKRASHALIAFLGQVEVAVTGPVEAGDFLVPSGRGDGRAIAVAPAALAPELVGEVVGRAWAAHRGGAGTVRALVGLNPADAAQAAALARLAAENAALRARLDRLEALLGAPVAGGR
jgi:hypothetical protein